MPTNVSIDFTRIVPHCGSQTLAFEEFCSQLARHVEVPDGSRFKRNGRGGDLGVECAWTLSDGRVWGWQAKYVFDVDGLRSQAEESFQTALNKHAGLSNYTICVPFEPSAAPGRGRSQQEKLADYKAAWEAIATDRGRAVTVDWWTPSALNDRLLAIDAHAGRRLYWFGTPVFTDEWFREHLSAAVGAAGPRYTPKPNVGHVLDSVLVALAGTQKWDAEVTQWRENLERLARECAEGISAASSGKREFPVSALSLAETLRTRLETLAPQLAVGTRSASRWFGLRTLADEACAAQEPLESALETALNEAHGEGASASTQFRQWQAEYNAAFPAHHYDRCKLAGDELTRFRRWLLSPELQAYLDGALLITGPAGIGKTHGVCDAALKRNDDRQRSLLLHGQRFRAGGSAWEQIRGQLGLGAEWSAAGLLDALCAAADTSGGTLVIFIDALNESQPRQQWLLELPLLLADVRARPELRLCVACRTGFTQQVIQEGVEIAAFEHPGFAGIEFDAAQSFFHYYNIEPLVGPLFDPEFSNPLFLKLICKTLQHANQRRLPTGWTGFRTVFRGLLNARDADWRTHHGARVDQAVTKSLETLAAEMATRSSRGVPVPDAIRVIDGLGVSGAAMLEQLLADELVMQFPGTGSPGVLSGPPDEISFAYERLGDHLQVQAALASLGTEPQVAASLLDIASVEPGYAEALAIQLPERGGGELLDLIRDGEERRKVYVPWLRALEWRDLSTIGARAEALLLERLRDPETFERALDAALVLAMRPDGSLDSRWLQTRLQRFPMPNRDAMWCHYLHEAWERGAPSPVRRIVAAAWNSPSGVEPALHLAWLRVLCWFFAASDRRVRDHATRAAIEIGRLNPSAWAQVCSELLDIDDDYIVERILAASYGTHLRARDDAALRLLANEVSRVFEDRVRANGLIRDHARCICDLALRRGVSIETDAASLRAPLHSEWPLLFPTDEELKPYESKENRERYPRIYESVLSEFGGDFAIYTIPPAIRRYKEVISTQNARRWVFRQVLDLGYSEGCAAYDWRTIQKYGAGRQRHGWAERIGKKYQRIALARLLGRLGDHVEPERETYSDSIHSPLTAVTLRDMDVAIDGRPVPEEQQRKYRRDETDLMLGTPSDDELWVADAAQVEKLEDDLWNLEHLGVRDWLPLEAHLSFVDRAVRPGDHGFRRQVWVQVRSYLVRAKAFERLWRWLRSRNFEERWMPEGWDISEHAFIGEYPHALSFGATGLPEMTGRVPQYRSPRPYAGPSRAENGPCAVIPTTHHVLSEFQEDSSDCDAASVCVPVPQLLGQLEWNGYGGYRDPGGRVVFSDPSVDANGPMGCFVQKRELEAYLANNGYSLVWTILAEKLPGTYEKIARLEYSHIRGWHSGAVRAARNAVLFRPH